MPVFPQQLPADTEPQFTYNDLEGSLDTSSSPLARAEAEEGEGEEEGEGARPLEVEEIEEYDEEGGNWTEVVESAARDPPEQEDKASAQPQALFDAKSFLCSSASTEASSLASGIVLANGENRALFFERTLLGTTTGPAGSLQEEVYLNTHEPFCIVVVGVQGAGKSHSLACILESCLVPLPPALESVTKLAQPLNALVLHYDTNVSSICEVTGLIATSPAFSKAAVAGGVPASVVDSFHLSREKMLILVSPSFYIQRKLFYGDYCIVKPLLFKWRSLTADHIRLLMRLSEDDSQLYVSVLLDLLRKYQRANLVPPFSTFRSDVERLCNVQGQQNALKQRLLLLESFVLESETNAGLADLGGDLSLLDKGMMCVIDITDPLLSKEEACGIFQVLTEQYEAHKYMESKQARGLSKAVVNCARLMRHDGLRLIVSTQSPLTLAPELLELCSLTILHRFYSQDWLNYLCKKLPVSRHLGEQISGLESGRALVFAARNQLDHQGWIEGHANLFSVAIRKRITSDRGATKVNKAKTKEPVALPREQDLRMGT